jgi:ribosomal protein S27E
VDDALRSDIVRVICPSCAHRTPLGIVRLGHPTFTMCENCGSTFSLGVDAIPGEILRAKSTS